METVSPLTRRANVGVAGRLHLVSDDVMVGLVRRAHDGAPFCLTRIFLPPEIGRKVLDRGVLAEKGQVASRTVIGVIDEVAPQRIAGAHQSVTAEAISADAAALLECAAGDPVLRIDRVYYDLSGKPLELAISHFNPDRYTYRIELSRSLPH
jgi:DNA-binding GntR family transcriptional regulator